MQWEDFRQVDPALYVLQSRCTQQVGKSGGKDRRTRSLVTSQVITSPAGGLELNPPHRGQCCARRPGSAPGGPPAHILCSFTHTYTHTPGRKNFEIPAIVWKLVGL